MSNVLHFWVCVQPLEDFQLPPDKFARESMRKACIDTFRRKASKYYDGGLYRHEIRHNHENNMRAFHFLFGVKQPGEDVPFPAMRGWMLDEMTKSFKEQVEKLERAGEFIVGLQCEMGAGKL